MYADRGQTGDWLRVGIGFHLANDGAGFGRIDGVERSPPPLPRASRKSSGRPPQPVPRLDDQGERPDRAGRQRPARGRASAVAGRRRCWPRATPIARAGCSSENGCRWARRKTPRCSATPSNSSARSTASSAACCRCGARSGVKGADGSCPSGPRHRQPLGFLVNRAGSAGLAGAAAGSSPDASAISRSRSSSFGRPASWSTNTSECCDGISNFLPHVLQIDLVVEAQQVVAELRELRPIAVVAARRQPVLLGAPHPPDAVVVRPAALGALEPPRPGLRSLVEERAFVQRHAAMVTGLAPGGVGRLPPWPPSTGLRLRVPAGASRARILLDDGSSNARGPPHGQSHANDHSRRDLQRAPLPRDWTGG